METLVEPFPIDERPPPPRRRHWPAIIGAAAVAVAGLAWFGSATDDQPSDDDNASPPPTAAPDPAPPPPSTDAVITDSAEESDDATALPPGPTSAAWVEPATGLSAKATVVVTAEQPFLTRPEAGVGFCAAGVEDACTSVPTSDHLPGNDTNQLTLLLPRTFTTWDGDRHDCVDDGPCEVRLWAQDGAVIELSIPVVFAPGNPAQPVVVEAAPTSELSQADVVSVSLPADATVVVLQCVADLVNGCGTADDFVQSPDGRATLDVTVDRRIFTRRGPYDCATGLCELRFILADGNHAEPIELEFDPATDLGLPIVSVRPAAGLAHGTAVELRTPNERAGVAGYSLCAPDEIVCAHLGNRAAGEELIVRLPRWIEDRIEARVVDCAVSRCVIRTLVADEVIDTVVQFTGEEAGRPETIVALGREADRALVAGDSLSVAARGLFVLSADATGPTGVDVRFCERPEAPTSQCVTTVGDGEGLRSDGSFTTTLQVPNFEFRRSRIDPDGARAPFCSEECWVVVEPRIDVPGGAAAVDIRSVDETTG